MRCPVLISRTAYACAMQSPSLTWRVPAEHTVSYVMSGTGSCAMQFSLAYLSYVMSGTYTANGTNSTQAGHHRHAEAHGRAGRQRPERSASICVGYDAVYSSEGAIYGVSMRVVLTKRPYMAAAMLYMAAVMLCMLAAIPFMEGKVTCLWCTSQRARTCRPTLTRRQRRSVGPTFA